MNQHMRPKRGFSLIEMLVFISVGSVIFFLSIQLIHLSMRISLSATQQREQDGCLSRIIRDFRRDLRRAAAVQVLSDGHLMLTSDSGSSIAWKVEDQAVLRTSSTDQMASHEHYHLGNFYEATFEHEAATQVIRLRILRTNEVAEKMSRLERLAECRVASGKLTNGQVQVSPTISTESAK